ncbi:ABC transporter substrate-binding protein [Mycetocola sp. JXN-3]|uniref:ABC transporter substrate-binding protein n=1 Tax=Mycetocola sp. JXN-3 TaxID=2116510 RepID=UPI001CAA81ED|nr:extracellular solute-binding protein [Mycetocola sp. JXN-3]
MKRHRSLTRTAALATTLTLGLALTACASGGDNAGGGDGKSLTLWTFKQTHATALEKTAEDFKAKTGITVKVQAITPDDAFVTKTQAAAKTGDFPDLLEVHSRGEDFTFGAAGLLENLADKITPEWDRNYLESVRNEGTVTAADFKSSQETGSKIAGVEEGQRLSVPLTIGTFGIVYANKERLAAAGITEAPKTWEEFIAALDAVKKTNPDNGGVTIGLKSPSTGLEWLMQPMGFGQLGKGPFEALFKDDKSKNWSSENGTKVLSEYNKINPYWMPGSQTLDIDQADLSFAQGKSSFLVGGTFTLSFLNQNGFDTENLMTFPVPPPADGAVKDLALAPFSLTGLSLSSSSKNKDAALKFMEFVSEPDNAKKFSTNALDLAPVDLGADPSTEVGPVLGAMMAAFGEAGPNTYNPGDTSYRPNQYDPGDVGALLMNMTPLAQTDPAQTGSKMAELIDSYWVTQKG